VFSVMLKKPMSFFDKNQSGELINILSDDTWVLSNAVTKIVANGLRSTIISVVGLIMMWTVSPDLFYVALWTVPPLGLITLKIGYHLKNARKEFQSRVAGSMKFAQERIINVATVRAFGQERQEIRNFRKKCENVLEVKDSASFVHSVFHGGVNLFI
jgi:ATP-binding cassette subfamily B (MDR/TAP) protein 10